ncbi:hypothetical protein A2U01_0094537, partial [Trifolium medium]|nr:hypothetical protein [Trifolium medium]
IMVKDLCVVIVGFGRTYAICTTDSVVTFLAAEGLVAVLAYIFDRLRFIEILH